MKLRWLFGAMSLCASFQMHAAITVDFNHSYTGVATANQNVGTISLAFTVDGQGTVTLDASSSDPDPAVYVDTFDGVAGSVSDASLVNRSFTITVAGIGNLRIDNNGLGLCIQGGNPQRLDAADESIRFELGDSSLVLILRSVAYANSTGGTLTLNGTGYPISSGRGQVATGLNAGVQSLVIDSTGDDDGQGFVLSGMTFDVEASGQTLQSIGANLLSPETVTLRGATAGYGFAGSANDVLILDAAGTILTKPTTGASSPVDIGEGQLVIEEGARWILDGAEYSGPFEPEMRFELARFGTFTGVLSGIRHRNFDIPRNRNLKLVQETGALYYEIVEQVPTAGPNIILVYMDDMTGGHHFGFEGRDCLTPTLDGLASNGLIFNEAFTASTVCSPSRYSLLTGRWPSRNPSDAFQQRHPLGTLARFENIGSETPLNTDNIAGWLREKGYRTGFVGKSHLIQHHLWNTSNWDAGGLMTYPKETDPAQNPTVNAAMQFNHRVIAQRHTSLGFDYCGGVYLANLKELYSTSLNNHNQEWLTQYARQFIDENHSQPFFLYLAPTVNHGPVSSDLRYSLRADRRYTGEGYVADPDFSFMPSRQSIRNEVSAAGKDVESARVTWVDYSMAAILDKLDEHGVADNTLIIFTSDHGHITELDALRKWGKSSLYDAGVRVPLIMHWPAGISSPGRRHDGLVQNVDISTTLLDIVDGSSLPSESTDGVSLKDILFGSNTPVRTEVYGEIGYARMVRTESWKLITLRYPSDIQQQIDQGFLWTDYDTGDAMLPRPYYVSNSGLASGPARTYPHYFSDNQLYDLTTDRNERSNLYGTHPAVEVDFKQRLSSFAGDVPGRPFGEFAPRLTTPPSVPANMDWSFIDNETLRITWSSTSTDAVGVALRQSINGGPPVVIRDFSEGTTAVTLDLAGLGEEVAYTLSSYAASGFSPDTNTVNLLDPEVWRVREFLGTDPGQLAEDSRWSADPDRDGLSNMLEYAFSLDPMMADSMEWPIVEVVHEGGDSFMQVPIPWDGKRIITIDGQWSSDLQTWISDTSVLSLVQTPDGYALRGSVALETSPAQFIQINLSTQ